MSVYSFFIVLVTLQYFGKDVDDDVPSNLRKNLSVSQQTQHFTKDW